MPHTAHAGCAFAPDRLAQRERGLQRRRRSDEHDVPRDRAAVVVLNDRQPRTHCTPVLVDDQDVELGVVGLPDLVGRRRFAAVDELEAFAVAHRPVMREHHEAGVERA